MASDIGGLIDGTDESPMPRPLIRTRARSQTGSQRRSPGPLHQGSLWAMVVLGVVSLSGLLFWVVAAARFADDDVGRAAAWYTLIQLVVIASAFGAPIVINRTGWSDRAPVTSGAALSLVTALALPAALVAPLFAGSEWRTLGDLSGLPLSLLMAVLVLGSALAVLVDARFVSLRRWRWLFARAAVPSVVRVLLLLIDPWDAGDAWIVVAAAGPIALAGLVALLALLRSGDIALTRPSALSLTDRRFFAVQHLGAVATQLPYHVVPFLVARQVAAATNAAFYFVWAIGVMVSMVPVVLTQVLLSETSLARTGRETLIRTTLAANVVVVGIAWAGSQFLAEPVLGLFGPTYRDLAPVLPFILLASLAWGVSSVCLTEARLAHDGFTTALITLTIAFGSLILALVLMPARPVWGATNAWLVANLLAAGVGIVAIERRRAGP